MAKKENLKSLLFHATDFTGKAKIKTVSPTIPKTKRIAATGTANSSQVNENSDSRKCLRAVVAGIVTMGGTLAALGATGLVKEPVTGCVAIVISFLFGFSIRLGAEYGITATPPPKSTS